MNKQLVKIVVCASCLSPEITDSKCICIYSKSYKTIELEFEKCNCCSRTDSQPAETQFNEEQYKKLKL